MTRVLITGANRGIGLEMARQYAQRGDEVIAVCRASNSQLQELETRVIEGVDVTSDDSVADLRKQLGEERIDRLVNNAGVLERNSLDDFNAGSMERQYQVNAIAPLRVTTALLPNLGKGSGVFIITSRMGSVDDNDSGGAYGYRMSKAAVNMAGKSLSIDLKERGIGVFLLHPGWVATEMTDKTGIPAPQSASGLLERMDSLDMGQTGTFWHQEGYQLPW